MIVYYIMATQVVKPQKITVSYANFDVTNLNVLPLTEHKMNNSQKLSMVRYKVNGVESLCQIQSPNTRLFTYGIPRIGQFFPNDKSRAHVKVPEDVNDPKSVAFFNKLESVDEYFKSADFKKKLFGSEKVAATYIYQPVVRSNEEDEDGNKTPGPRYIKVKIDLEWETNKVLTKCMIKQDGKRVPVNDVNTIDDLSKYVRFQSNICMVMIMNKIYASKNKVGGESKKYGATFKLSQIVCDALTAGKDSYDVDAFIDDEDDMPQLSGVKITTTNTATIGQSSVSINLAASALDSKGDDEEDEENDDEEDEEDDEEVVETAPITPVKAAKPVQVPAAPKKPVGKAKTVSA